MSTLKASTARQFQLVADHLHYATIDEYKALEELARRENNGEEGGAYVLYLTGFGVDTAMHHWHHGKAIMNTAEPNPPGSGRVDSNRLGHHRIPPRRHRHPDHHEQRTR